MKEYKQYYTSSIFNIENKIDISKDTVFITPTEKKNETKIIVYTSN